jgi:hypothetical protein
MLCYKYSFYLFLFYFLWLCSPARAFRSRGFLITHNDALQSVGLSGRVISSSQRPQHDITQQSRQTSMPLVGFESTILADKQPLGTATRGISKFNLGRGKFRKFGKISLNRNSTHNDLTQTAQRIYRASLSW